MVSFIIFRADSLESGVIILRHMLQPEFSMLITSMGVFLLNLVSLKNWVLFHMYGYEQYIAIAVFVTFLMPNTIQLMSRYNPCMDVNGIKFRSSYSRFNWRAGYLGLVFSLIISVISLLNISGTTEFLYFQF